MPMGGMPGQIPPGMGMGPNWGNAIEKPGPALAHVLAAPLAFYHFNPPAVLVFAAVNDETRIAAF